MKVPVDEAPAGLAMDVAVAKLLGWSYVHSGSGWRWRDPDGIIGRAYDKPPRYSTDNAAALKAILPERYLIAKDTVGFHVRETLCVTHRLELGQVEYITQPLASGETLALAICRASLKTNGIEYVEVEDESAD